MQMRTEPDALVRELQDRFSKAELIGGDAAFEKLVAKVIGFVEQPRLGQPNAIRAVAQACAANLLRADECAAIARL
jgi:hypothetical protein